ncbi:MAG: outer membrane lipoprotein chaperone LolA [Ignavibacteria bacterium]|nr:outer membrane lipoprotein chaperone LolA [Ignavibacteria bacterium]
MKTIKILFAFIIISAISTTLYSQDAQEIIKKVQNNYKDLNDAKAEFSMTEKFSGGKSTSSSGTIMIQKENKYKIKTKNYTLVTDGITTWSYSPSKKQVVIDNYKDDGSTFSPNKFLFNYPENFYSDYVGEEKVNKKDCYVLKLTPRNKGNIKSAKIWVDQTEYIIRKITINTSESTKTYTLKSITLNPGLSSSEFKFTPPEGVEVIDLR